MPHLAVDTRASACVIDRYGNTNCSASHLVYRQLSYNTDPDTPAVIPGGEGKFTTWNFETVEPEEQRYSASLSITPADLTRPEGSYIFIPQLRRAQPVSSNARCSPGGGTDVTPEDFHSGFDSNITQLKFKFLGEKKILALLGFDVPKTAFPEGYDLPLGWPKPSWGKWQLRDVYVISVKKLPALAAGYCYGNRVMYIDKQFFAPLWQDLYDAQLNYWKALALFLPTVDVPGLGPVSDTVSKVQVVWDMQNRHSTFFIDPGNGSPLYNNEQVPKDYQDVTRYTDPGGLNMIMR
jgi:Protein of unknown function (DUF1329)